MIHKASLLLALTAGALTLGTAALDAGNPAYTWDNDPNGIKVFILAGQSNMVGYGKTEIAGSRHRL